MAFPNRKDTRCTMSVIHLHSKLEKPFLVICFFDLLALPSVLASPECLQLAWAVCPQIENHTFCAARLGGREC